MASNQQARDISEKAAEATGQAQVIVYILLPQRR